MGVQISEVQQVGEEIVEGSARGKAIQEEDEYVQQAGAAAALTKDRVNRVTPKQTSNTKYEARTNRHGGRAARRRPSRGPEASVGRDENRTGDGRTEAADGEDEHGSIEEDRPASSHEAQLARHERRMPRDRITLREVMEEDEEEIEEAIAQHDGTVEA
jgi:hypothetical protein